MKRLYYVTSHINSAEKIADDMHKEGITDWHFHVLSKDSEGLYKHHVHSANYFQKFDVIHSSLRGVIIGGIIGLALGLTINTVSGFSALSLPLLVLIGVLLGAWLGGVIGQSHENYKIARFHDDIEAGKYLIMLDIRKGNEDFIKKIMAHYHPEAKMSGEDTTFINPFKGHMGASIK